MPAVGTFPTPGTVGQTVRFGCDISLPGLVPLTAHAQGGDFSYFFVTSYRRIKLAFVNVIWHFPNSFMLVHSTKLQLYLCFNVNLRILTSVFCHRPMQ